ncbi:MAG TPA: UDP-2,3-diacylglucosamine diphosphatase [Gemmatimonadales bacterium]|jgi:UDP-2,3-diacylglucosamine hydrolase|nr:UDP-2,3-diacylglucosamine diphosphatase [Gemmatimonadales bacterium]
MFRPVLGETLVVVSDAHLGHAPPRVEEALLDFLERVPELGDCLLVNGDLFEFWFAYARVIPRTGFRVAAALGQLRRRLPVLMVGGNHDRWGRAFWHEELGLTYAPDRLEFELGGRRVLALHGDRIGYGRPRSRLLHRLVSTPLATAVYRWLHPELGFPLVYSLSARLGDHATEGPIVDRSAERQRAWAKAALAADPGLGLVILGHTHRASLEEPFPGRQVLNPGAWFDGFRYAIATRDGAELRQFTPAAPLPPPPQPAVRR